MCLPHNWHSMDGGSKSRHPIWSPSLPGAASEHRTRSNSWEALDGTKKKKRRKKQTRAASYSQTYFSSHYDLLLGMSREQIRLISCVILSNSAAATPRKIWGLELKLGLALYLWGPSLNYCHFSQNYRGITDNESTSGLRCTDGLKKKGYRPEW